MRDIDGTEEVRGAGAATAAPEEARAAATLASAAAAAGPRRWLLKTEPADYAWGDLEREGRVAWDGVRNPLALIHMRCMREGDPVLVYHAGRHQEVVGLARVARGPYPDPASNGDPRHVAVDFAPVSRVRTVVGVAAIRAEPACAGLALLRQPRLFVMPVPPPAWDTLARLAGL